MCGVGLVDGQIQGFHIIGAVGVGASIQIDAALGVEFPVPHVKGAGRLVGDGGVPWRASG